jgi:hypothetical protein
MGRQSRRKWDGHLRVGTRSGRPLPPPARSRATAPAVPPAGTPVPPGAFGKCERCGAPLWVDHASVAKGIPPLCPECRDFVRDAITKTARPIIVSEDYPTGKTRD